MGFLRGSLAHSEAHKQFAILQSRNRAIRSLLSGYAQFLKSLLRLQVH